MSDTYVSREKRCEARQWGRKSRCRCQPCLSIDAEMLVRWIQAHGGEARYEPAGGPSGPGEGSYYGHPARIILTTSTGPQYLYPGWYAVMGEEKTVQNRVQAPSAPEFSQHRGFKKLREFLPVDPAAFEAEWEPKR